MLNSELLNIEYNNIGIQCLALNSFFIKTIKVLHINLAEIKQD